MIRKRVLTAIYNPHLLAREDLVATFVARQALLDELVDDLRRGGKQHHLLVGGRGSGKTTLLLRLAYALEDDPKLARSCVALRFPEEQYNVSRPSDFWMNCIDALTDVLERQGDRKGSAELDAAVGSLDERAEDERAREALRLLTGWTKRTKRMLVLLVDNLDLVLSRLPDDLWQLREAFSGDNGLVLIGASSAFVEDTFLYDSPFYDFFNVHELAGLSEPEARRLVIELARSTGTPQVEQAIESDPGRFKALYILTGGTPRTLALLHGVLAAEKNARVEEDLEGLLDQMTPYYKARFDDLPAQSQVIVDAVALHWHPVTAAECAHRAHLDINVVSAQLNRLTRQGMISKVALAEAGRLGFQISERFFNIWYLMRASRRLRRRLGWLVEFLRVFYGEDEVRKRAEALLTTPAGRKSAQGGAAAMLAFASAVADLQLRRRLEARAIGELVDGRHVGSLGELLDLEGEDAHLLPMLHRTRATQDLRRDVIASKINWPTGVSAGAFAEALCCQPFLSWTDKRRLWARVKPDSPRLSVEVGKAVLEFVRLHAAWLDRLGPDLVRAIGAGEVPSVPDLRSPAELEGMLRLARTSALMIFDIASWEASSPPFALLDDLFDKALEFDELTAPILLILAREHIRNGRWPLARRRLLQTLRHWPSTEWIVSEFSLETLRTCVAYGHAADFAAMLAESGMAEQLLPLYEALRAAAIGPKASLAHLAPEARAPAEEMLQELFATGDTAPRPLSKGRRPPTPRAAHPRKARRT